MSEHCVNLICENNRKLAIKIRCRNRSFILNKAEFDMAQFYLFKGVFLRQFILNEGARFWYKHGNDKINHTIALKFI